MPNPPPPTPRPMEIYLIELGKFNQIGLPRVFAVNYWEKRNQAEKFRNTFRNPNEGTVVTFREVLPAPLPAADAREDLRRLCEAILEKCVLGVGLTAGEVWELHHEAKHFAARHAFAPGAGEEGTE